MSYTACIAGLKSTLAGASGITKVVNGRPTALQAWPLIYLWADRGERTPPGGSQVTVYTYFVNATLCIPFQDNYIAEDQIGPFINVIPAAIDVNATLGGAANVAYVTEYRSDIRQIGEVECRVVDFTVFIRDKGARGSGI